VGGIYNHIELEAEDGDLVADSGHELGWEAGAGFAIPLGQRFAVTPGVRYRTFSAQLDLGDGRMDVDLSYVVIDVGMSYAFGRRPVRTALR
jgi:opacity protein-like surface antigen